MPTLAHLVPRALEGSTTSGGISATAIGLIVGIGVVPVFVLIWVVSWLFWGYPNDRNWCCMRRKKKQADSESMLERESTIPSQETIYEKKVYNVPERPMTNPHNESGNLAGGNRLTKTDPRISMQTIGSNSTVQVVQEPKRFV
jgi:hypothetical protein